MSTNNTWVDGSLGDTNGWNNPDGKQADAQKTVVYPRHSTINSRIRESAIQGWLVGDSIAGGSGASNINNTFPWVFANKMLAAYGFDKNVWAPTNNGVGGETVANIIPYLAHALDVNQNVTRGVGFNYAYWILCTGRNDSAQIDITTFSKLYRTVVRMGIRAGIDVFCFTEPPKMDMGTRQENDPAYPQFADEIRRIALDEGASLVDLHLEMRNRMDRGEDISQYTGDGVHPNDSGYQIMADLFYRCFTGESNPVTKENTLNAPKRNGYYAIGQFTESVLNSAAVVAVTGLQTNATSRSRQTGTNNVVEVQSGGYVDFEIQNCKSEYLIVTLLNKSTNTGTCTVQSPTGLNLPGGSGFRAAAAGVQEKSFIINVNTPADINFPTARTVRLMAVGGPIQVACVTVVSPILTTVHDTVKGTEVGTWSDASSQSLTWRSASTVGDTVTVEWYGTDLSIDVERAAARGVIGYATDGGTKQTYDAYLATPLATNKLRVAINLAKGWHKTVFSVETKNASASANTVNIRNLRVYSTGNNQGSVISKCEPGVTVYAPDGVNYVRGDGLTVPTITGIKVTTANPMIIETAIK